MRVAEKRIVRTDRVSVSTNMLGVTPSNTLSVKVILQITWWSLLSTKYLHSLKQATAFDESESV